jgi:protease secretion system membrane fusion protein
VDTSRKAVQHVGGGIVREVLVREGEHVQAGQLLLHLDDRSARAQLDASRDRYHALRAAESRWLAERSGQPRISFHPDLLKAQAEPGVAEYMRSQQGLLDARRAALQAELDALAASVRSQEAAISGFETVLASRREQLELLRTELATTAELVREGYAPRNRQLELQRQVAELESQQADLRSSVQRARQSMIELQERANQRREEQLRDRESAMAEVVRDLRTEQERIVTLQVELERTEIRAVATGQVVALATQTQGGVITPGQRLMDIVPDADALVLEARIPPPVIDRVRPGLEADVRFSAFVDAPQLVVGARLISVSADTITDPRGGEPFYLARLQVTPEGAKALVGRVLRPGMPADVVVRTGARSLLSYLFSPLRRRLATALKEA